jgi:ferredoxin-NADP reductase
MKQTVQRQPLEPQRGPALPAHGTTRVVPPSAPTRGAPGTTVRLLGHETLARDTMAFHFTRPPGFAFTAGQAITLTLADPPRGEAGGSRHTFSLVSAPHEPELVIATRMRSSPFKQALGGLVKGAELRIDGPFGSLALHASRSRAAIFIAGGIGITPFVSMLRQAFHERLPQVITLVYLNRSDEDAAYLAELQDMQQQHPGSFQLIPIRTGSATAPPSASVDVDFVRSLIVRPGIPVFYVAGPPAMVAAMRAVLARSGVRDDDVRSEAFSGY